ncbi:hypothetical protein L9F63_016387, partial [Diploptera punctata]
MTSEKHDIELKAINCMKLCVKLLKISGVWYTGETKSVVRYLYNKFTFFCAYILTFCTYLQLYVSRDNFEEFLEEISITISLTMILLKINIFTFKKEKALYVMKTIPQNFFIHQNSLSTENTEIIRITLEKGRKMIMLYCGLMFCGNSLYTVISPLLTSAPDSHNTTEVFRPLPFKIWLPFDVMASPYYQFTYVFTTYGGLMLGAIVVAADLFFFVTMIYLTGQFTLLSDTLCNIRVNIHKNMSRNHKNEKQYINAAKNTGMYI